MTMKMKSIVLLLFCVTCAFTATAQTLTIGPRIGVNLGRQIYDEDDSDLADFWNEEVQMATGLQAGLVTNVKFSDLFSVQPELLYTVKGYKFESNDRIVTGRYDYLDVPVLAKISIGNGPLQGFVTLGPTFSYWMGGENQFETDNGDFTEDINFDDENDGVENQFEAGASLGLGLAYNTGVGALNLDLRYGAGLSSVYDSDDDAKLRNESFGITLAYLFGL
ncbi:porin family protein [Pontibacter sp. H259]|uniref:porin family protein n=1 Tax=Pontibacter sp. H259 TaxID=3133421 RepID=UPI0030C13B48